MAEGGETIVNTLPVGDHAEGARLLTPYLPRLVIDWLRQSPDTTHRTLNGTAMFADISGFTNLSEQLSRKGKIGAEEMGDVLNMIFEQLLGAAYEYGAGLVKWGGDAVLLFFENEGHPDRACRAAFEMQQLMHRLGRVSTSAGTVRLKMSIGIHSGDFEFLLVGRHFRELFILGPGATAVAHMEKDADAGEIVVSQHTAASVMPAVAPLTGAVKGEGVLLVNGPSVGRQPNRAGTRTEIDLRGAFSGPLRDHLLSGVVEAEHRNVTVAFVEFTGTDALLAQQGPAALETAVTQFANVCQDAAEANGVTFLSSDIYEDGAKVILISGAPMSSGDDEARILTAVRAVIDGGGVLPVKAGINRGRVFAGDFGPSYRRVYSITGDIVNLAARLMAKAKPGEIIATPEVLARSRTSFESTDLEPFMVKGKDQPIHAVLVGPIIRQRQTASLDLPLIGRESELVVLQSHLARAAAGRGQLIELVGDAGMGKSRLLEELASTTASTLLWADGDIYGTATPYQPLQRLFHRQLGLPEAAPMEQVAAALSTLLTDVAPDLVPWLPLIGIVVGVDFPLTEEVRTLDPELRQAKLEASTSLALGHLLTTPTLFVFNDTHFMDEATIGLIRQLGRDIGDRPWLLVVTRRADGTDIFSSDDDRVLLELAPLTGPDADRLLEIALGSTSLPTHRLQALAERAGGSPLFLRELGASAIDANFDDIPSSVEGMIAARIDRLPPSERRLLRSAAVLGMTIDIDLLAGMLSVDGPVHPELLGTLDQLGEYVVGMPDRQFRFAHNLIRETAYEGLSYRRKSLLHARAADLIEARAGERAEEVADLLSLHSLHGQRFHAAWDYSRIAGERARERYANADAADCYRRALSAGAHLPSLTGDAMAEVLETLSDIYVDLGEFNLADAMLDSARRHSRTNVLRLARVCLKTASHRSRLGKNSDALRWVTRTRRVLEDHAEPEARQMAAELAWLYAVVRFHQGHHRDSLVWAERAIAEAQACADKRTEAEGLLIYGIAGVTSGRSIDDARVHEALVLFSALGDLRGQARAYNVLGMCAYFGGHWDSAVESYSQAESILRTVGREFQAAMNAANRAEILVDQGRYDVAEGLLNEAIPQLRGANSRGDLAFARFLQGRIATGLRQYEHALSVFAEARSVADEIGENYQVLTIDAYMAECHLASGDPARSFEAAEATLHGLKGDGEVATLVPLLERICGTALIQLGRYDEGVHRLRTSLAAARVRAAGHEIAAALGAMTEAEAAADAAEATSWKEERNALIEVLGLVVAGSTALVS